MYSKCRHVMPSGSRCHSPALSGTLYCYFHTGLRRQPDDHTRKFEQSLSLPVMEDHSAIQIGLARVLDALGSDRIDPRRAGLLLYGLQIAAQNLKHGLLAISSVHSLTPTSDGEVLAPEEEVCEYPEDCSTCAERDTCKDFDPEDVD